MGGGGGSGDRDDVKGGEEWSSLFVLISGC